jgi:hypothetical protein
LDTPHEARYGDKTKFSFVLLNPNNTAVRLNADPVTFTLTENGVQLLQLSTATPNSNVRYAPSEGVYEFTVDTSLLNKRKFYRYYIKYGEVLTSRGDLRLI